MRGRKPKPTVLKLIEGNRGKRRLPENEPASERELLETDAPAWMAEEVREVWRRELERAPRGLLQLHHAELFAAYCQALHEMRRAAEMLAKSPPVVRVGKGDWAQWQLGPAQTAFSRNAELVRKLAAEFGLTPTSSPRAAGAVAADADSNPFAALVRRR